jgi:hypothetical protein
MALTNCCRLPSLSTSTAGRPSDFETTENGLTKD